MLPVNKTCCNYTNPIYRVFNVMIKRTECVSHPTYQYVGARGIRICPEWRNNFREFERWALSHGWAHGLYLDRIDNDNGYSPDNCRFITPEQSACNRRNNVYITAWGETKLQRDWLLDPRCKVSHRELKRELDKCVSPEQALTHKNPKGRRGEYITAWGETKGAVDWTRDARCNATREQIKKRVNAGVSPEDAISHGSGYKVVKCEGVARLVPFGT